jgi:hypothetical protein
MPEVSLVVRNRLSGEGSDIEVSDTVSLGELAQALRQEWELPEKDSWGTVMHKLVLQRSGILLDSAQTLRDAGLRDQDTLSLWGEPTAAASPVRLRSEHRRVLERFGSHQRVKVETIGDPPVEYKVTYLVKGPTALKGGSLVFGTTHTVKICIPENYPSDKPMSCMLTPTYHPNISADGRIDICYYYYTLESIADLIAEIGNYLQYKEYELASGSRSDVRQWIQSQGGKVGPFDDVGFGDCKGFHQQGKRSRRS